ncbi:MAG: response regulator [Bacteroidales bacterium]
METRKKILLIDDDIDVIAVVETILENEGYNVVTACNKAEGIAKAVVSPDLQIVDVMMTTQFEGFELAEAFVTDPRFKGMPVMMQTGLSRYLNQMTMM